MQHPNSHQRTRQVQHCVHEGVQFARIISRDNDQLTTCTMQQNIAESGVPTIPNAVRYGLYPTLVVTIISLYVLSKANDWPLAKVFLWMSLERFGLLLALEFAFPARTRWRMTWRSFVRDLKYMALNGGAAALLKIGVVAVAIDASQFNLGLLTGMSVWIEVLAILLTFEFFQYWLHRISHEGKGLIGGWLWRVHAAHHLPNEVYLLMHAVGHPLNVLFIAIVQLPLVLLGASGDAMFLFGAVMGLQGLISHFNVDVRAGIFNYVVVGTELHRYHHSDNLSEAKNFGAITPIWDIVFGTFVYRPGILPRHLGVVNAHTYPHSAAVAKTLALPFRRSYRSDVGETNGGSGVS
jgi:sterol desaturase/sphingolipid hydroxylase (fatty acid hydroxylase superfamily)